MPYFAHKDKTGQRFQTAKEHLENVAELCKTFADEFGYGDYAYFIGKLHDLGKYSKEFQARLLEDAPRVDHSLRGALEFCPVIYHLSRGYNWPKVPGALCIAGHHTGLPNLTENNPGELDASPPSLLCRINKHREIEPVPEIDSVWRTELDLPNRDSIKQLSPPSFSDSSSPRKSKAFFTYFLFSCLEDADSLDTINFDEQSNYIPNTGDWDKLISKLSNHVKEKFFSVPNKSELNEKRCAVLQDCIRAGQTGPRGLYTLTVPTGGGKTISSLAFALHHAKANNLKRIIYVIPYTSIIEQNAQTFRDILEKNSAVFEEKVVLEHQSNYEFPDKETPENKTKIARATENWNFPIIVTTAVQFFESLFANKRNKSRKVHNLANSVVIFDEAQMLPTPFLNPCVFAISELVAHYGVTAVLCTATQPALADKFTQFIPNLKSTEICSENLIVDKIFERVTFEYQKEEQSLEQIADQLAQYEQVLCIVNSRKKARQLYQILEAKCPAGEVFHLSTSMVSVHRQKKLAEIRQRLDPDDLENRKPCKVISTSLIEAGVDVDFPRVFREINGLDSILQAAGRCNRNGKQSKEESIVTIFDAGDQKIPFFRQPISTARRVLNSVSLTEIASPKTIKSYFHNLLWAIGENSLDESGIMNLLNDYRYRDVAQRFHIIQPRNTVFIPFDIRSRILVQQWLSGERNRDLLHGLGRYSVSLYDNEYNRLEQMQALITIPGPESPEQTERVAVLGNLGLYSDSFGLNLGEEIRGEAWII